MSWFYSLPGPYPSRLWIPPECGEFHGMVSRLPPSLTALISSSMLVSNRSSNASPQVRLSTTWIENLSFTLSKTLLDYLQLAVTLCQQMSGWLRFPSRIRACEHGASCSWSKNASSTGFPWWGGLQSTPAKMFSVLVWPLIFAHKLSNSALLVFKDNSELLIPSFT